MWTAYNAFMPLFYERFTASFFVIGLLMTLDNLAALTLYFGIREPAPGNHGPDDSAGDLPPSIPLCCSLSLFLA